MIRTTLLAVSALALMGTAAFADPIEATWKRSNGTLIKYASAGGNKYCGTVLTGEYANKSIGCMSGANGSYKGKVNKLDEGKEYTGKASISGNKMKLAGCVALVLCKSETLTKQ